MYDHSQVGLYKLGGRGVEGLFRVSSGSWIYRMQRRLRGACAQVIMGCVISYWGGEY